MTQGILALVERSLRVDARSFQSHLARFGLIAAIYVSLCVTLEQSAWFGAPGLRFFNGIAYLNLTFMSLLGISFFSTSISEEKEEHTLGLMLMAGISPLGILIGKTGGRFVQAVLLIAVQYPFTLLALTMGGISRGQINAVYMGLIAYLVLLTGFGLLCSTIGTNNRSAATRMILGLAVYTLVPLLAARTLATTGASRISLLAQVLTMIADFSVFQQFSTILTTGFGDPTFSWQVSSNTCFGIGCFGLAWVLFGFVVRNPESEADSRGIVSVNRGTLRLFSPGRPWTNPFVWKDFYFVSGGLLAIPIRLALCYGLWIIVVVTNSANEVVSAYQVFLSLAIVIEAGRILAGSLRDEIRGQTLNSLVMLPRSPIVIIYSKFAGAMLGWIPVALVDLLVSVYTTQGRRNFDWIFDHPMGFCITSFFVLIPNLSAVLALYLRWGAVPLGTVITIGLFSGMMSFVRGDESIGLVIGCVVFFACFLCHLTIVLRVSSLAEK